MNLIFDLETDGLLEQFTCIHCLCIHDLDNNETYTFNDKGTKEAVVRGVEMLEDADSIIGHNIIYFDLPVIRRVYPWFSNDHAIDTLLLSRLYHPNIMAIDQVRQWASMPQRLYGRHSLESYGHRLSVYKGDFSKTADWKQWSQEMEDYMEQDVKVTTKLWEHFQPFLNGSRWNTK